MNDKIVFDYGGDLMITETATVMDYIGAMVGSVKEKAGPPFVFKMSRHLWEGLCDLYVLSLQDR